MPVEIHHPSLIKVGPNSTIYRYFELDKFEYLLRDRALFFCRCDKFENDLFEGSVPKTEVENRPSQIKNIASYFNHPISDKEVKQKDQGLGNVYKKLKKSFVVNCWHINNGESDAMWKLYTNKGIAIRSTVKNLIVSLKDCKEQIYLSKVSYKNYDIDIFDGKPSLLSPIVHKRKAFAHENDVRLIEQVNEAVKDVNYWETTKNHKGKNIACNINKLINKIILCPKSDIDSEENVKSLLNKFGFNYAIEKSKLDDEPIY